MSADGKWLGSTMSGTAPHFFTLFDIEGKRIRTMEVPLPNWAWLPDSSGIFIALDAPQRASTLGIAELAGGPPRDTGLQMTGATLSRDGRWVIANHQTGCCAAIEQREIWIAPRAGGAPRVLATATSQLKQPIGVIGIDAQDRLVYHDARQIKRIPLGGGPPQSLGTLDSDRILDDDKGGRGGNMSPDGTAVLVRTLDPDRWYVVASDRVTPWDPASGTIVEDRGGARLLYYIAALWVGPHAVLVRTAAGGLASIDVTSGAATALAARLDPSDLPLAYDRGRLLVARGSRGIVIELATGRWGDAGVDLRSDPQSTIASALPAGGFIVSTETTTYRID